MGVKVLFILEQSTSFVARTLINELKKRDIDIIETKPDTDAILKLPEIPQIWFLYLNDSDDPVEDVLELASKMVDKKDVRFFIGGAKSELAYLLRDYPAEMVVKLFERPLSADDISETLKDEAGNIMRSFYAKKVMVVDDDPVQLQTMKNLLSKSFRVYTANSGLNAFKILTKIHVDLILLDYEMPTVNGPEVADKIRHNPDTEDIPIMFLTAKNDVRSVVNGMHTGSVDYILKSTPHDVILEKLNNFFS